MKLMYHPHPAGNRMRVLMPETLLDAVQHVQRLTFKEIEEMRRTIRDLADFVTSYSPDLIPFFATGSIPYVMPLLDLLNDGGERDLTDGTRFHLFPGLSWGGRLDGMRSLEFFTAEFRPLLQKLLATHQPVRVLSIDTTNTGNAVNRIVSAFEAVCEGIPDVAPDRLEFTIVGIINGQRARHGSGKTEILGAPGRAYVLTPNGYQTAAVLNNHEVVRFTKKKGRFALSIAYWVASNIPSEDEVELIGAVGLHRSLLIEPDGTPGRIEIVFDNGTSSESTGLDATGRRFLHLLSEGDASSHWLDFCRANAEPPLSETEQADYEEGKFWTRGGLRLFELNHSEPAIAIASLLGKEELESVEIYWLCQQQPFPAHALELVAHSARKDPKTRGPEALQFFRLALPDIARTAPTGENALDWWLGKISGGTEADFKTP